MPINSLEARAIALALASSPSSTTLAPGPASAPSNPKAALRRCCAAWQRAFNAYMKDADPENSMGEHLGRQGRERGLPQRHALLAGYEGARDFVACVAHGILIGAIPENKAGQLLYAAQVALATIPHERKKLLRMMYPHPLPLQNPLFLGTIFR